jgi:hypothetical protein
MSEKNQLQNNKDMEVNKYNAQKHMILRETPTEYEKVDADKIYNELSDDLRPVGRTQEMLIEIIANNVIKLTRIGKAEGEVVKEAMSPDLGLGTDYDGKEYKPNVDSQAVEKLNLCSRYQTATENRIYRALAVLKQLKTYEQS